MNKWCLRNDKLFIFTAAAVPIASQLMVAQTKGWRVCPTLLRKRRRAEDRVKESDVPNRWTALTKIPETGTVLLAAQDAIDTMIACISEEKPPEAAALANMAFRQCSFDRKHRLTPYPLAIAPDEVSWSSNCEMEFITFFTSTDSFEIGHFPLQRLRNDHLMYPKSRANGPKEGKTLRERI
jgi:hypothetical protein